MNEPELKAWPAPAKLNLMLRVVGRRSDGYHLLQTVFQFLEFGDLLYFRPRKDGRLKRRRPLPGVRKEDDLVLRAAGLLQQQGDAKQGVEVDLQKRLPMGGGLGGGSSDAATVLVALDYYWGLGLGTERLMELGLALGADVPVFIRGRAAWAEGVGEILTPLSMPEPWYLVLVPSCHLSTREIFSDPDLTRNSKRITMAQFLAGNAVNDCVPVVRKRYPQVARALDWLEQFGNACLTGTGGCAFVAFDDQAGALEVMKRVPSEWRGFVSRGTNRSPLSDAF